MGVSDSHATIQSPPHTPSLLQQSQTQPKRNPMPNRHAKDKKLEALALLSYGQSVSTVHFATGIPIRTLYNWKTRLKRKYERQLARKHAENAANAPQNREFRHKTADSCHTVVDPCHNHADENNQLPQDCQKDAVTASNPENTDVEDFTFIRDKLMK